MTGTIWQGVHSKGQSAISIQFIKRAVQDFVRNLESNDEGIKDEDEYNGVIDDLTSFLQDKVYLKYTNTVISYLIYRLGRT